MDDANSGQLNSGRLTGSAAGLVPADVAGYEAKQRALQQFAMNSHIAGQERSLRIQVLGMAAGVPNVDPVKTAEEFWAFVTAGDPAPE